MNLLDQTLYGNSIKSWIIALFVALAAFIVLRLLKAIAHRKVRALAEKTTTDLDDLVADLIDRLKYFFLFIVSVYLGSRFLDLSAQVKLVIGKLVTLCLIAQGVFWGGGILDYFLDRHRRKKKEEGDTASLMTFAALGFMARLVLWSIAVLLALDNLGIRVTALVAGLGVGGIAVALAVQNILGDLFASMSIVLDKPFVIGDFIIVDNFMGNVEHIGLKTTRIRSLSGEQIIFANSDLLKSRIKNYKRMEERRAVFSVGVVYQTPHEKLADIPRMIREIIEAQELARFDRSHFKEFGDSALIFENVYYVKKPDFASYIDTQQAINLALCRRFQEEGIEFAYPTRTIFISQESGESGLRRPDKSGSGKNPDKFERNA
ncbi:MAG: mechanosensitive ion channel family protein [Candidatus Aminicenantes bacterium]|nr:mechanosensitive ion channel family protein [Candidatus Aminicenantes bacterium]